MTESGAGEQVPARGDRTGGASALPHAPPVLLRDLPGAAEGGPWWWSRRRACALDVCLAVVSTVECAWQGVTFARDTGMSRLLFALLGVVVGATLLLRRRWPVAVSLVALAVTPLSMGLLLEEVGLYTLAACATSRRAIAALSSAHLVSIAVLSFVELRYSDSGLEDAPLPTLLLISLLVSVAVAGPPLFLGLYVGARRRLVESLRERADGLERELSLLAEHAEQRAEWARREERTRIAREMHDVVAHRVSLMVIHAAALQAVARKDPQKASRNAALIGDMGRQALTELRAMLRVLRSDDGRPADAPTTGPGGDGAPDARGQVGAAGEGAPEGDALARIARYAAASAQEGGDGAGPGPTAADAPPTADGPGLADLEALVGQSKAAGMPVELSVEGEARRYTARVEQTAYRVVQEALTNVHKHAAGAVTRVRLARREAEVAVQVENEAPAEGAAAPAGLPSGGNGLVGMRERVTALGGGCVYGPTERGGFRVSVVLPDRG